GSSADLFTDPANNDFSLKDATVKAAGAGDPRWLK
ncbi:MAG: DUF5123 domain-containing protein, partial [Alistipes sp.]|nr:DUF5123 domain-containing protein [Alistipes sp.]